MDAPPARYLSVRDDYQIAYFVRGRGPTFLRVPVIWNHISRQWTPNFLGPFFDAMADHFRFVLYDGRGQGFSTRGLDESLFFDDYVSDLEAVADAVETGPFLLIGMAQMSVVAISYAIKHPERVKALVLWNYSDYTARPVTLVELASKDWPRFVDVTARMGFPEYDANMVKDVLYDAVDQRDLVRQIVTLREGPSGEELLPQVTVPTLFLASREGTWSGSAELESKHWVSMVPNARLALIGGQGAGLTSSGGSGFEVVLRIEEFLGEIKESPAREVATPAAASTQHTTLSLRQTEVLAHLAKGKTNREIADDLVISVRTVERHLAEAYAKLGASNRYQAILEFQALTNRHQAG